MSTDRSTVSMIKNFGNLFQQWQYWCLVCVQQATENYNWKWIGNFQFSFSLVDNEWRFSEVDTGSIPGWCGELVPNWHCEWRKRDHQARSQPVKKIKVVRFWHPKFSYFPVFFENFYLPVLHRANLKKYDFSGVPVLLPEKIKLKTNLPSTDLWQFPTGWE